MAKPIGMLSPRIIHKHEWIKSRNSDAQYCRHCCVLFDYGPSRLCIPRIEGTPIYDLSDDKLVDIANEVHIAMPEGSDEQEGLLAVIKAVWAAAVVKPKE